VTGNEDGENVSGNNYSIVPADSEAFGSVEYKFGVPGLVFQQNYIFVIFLLKKPVPF